MSEVRRHFKALHDALVASWGDQDDLALFVRGRLGINLAEIAPPSTLPSVVAALIGWAERHGRLHELVLAALAERPDNAVLIGLARSLCASQPAGEREFYLRVGDEPRQLALRAGQFCMVGRDPRANIAVPATDLKASVRHAMLEIASWGVIVRDLGSKNGTFVNERPIKVYWLSGNGTGGWVDERRSCG